LDAAVRELKLDQFWDVDRSIAGSDKCSPTIIAKRNEQKPFRLSLPNTITSFIAEHVEKGTRINQHKIKCRGGEDPNVQAKLVPKAFTKPMEISEWKLEDDGLVHMQCRRLEYVDIRFRLGDRVIDSWQQAGNRGWPRCDEFGQRLG
jgi:hypothetical protein